LKKRGTKEEKGKIVKMMKLKQLLVSLVFPLQVFGSHGVDVAEQATLFPRELMVPYVMTKEEATKL
jgi:hypothetical protein